MVVQVRVIVRPTAPSHGDSRPPPRRYRVIASRSICGSLPRRGETGGPSLGLAWLVGPEDRVEAQPRQSPRPVRVEESREGSSEGDGPSRRCGRDAPGARIS